MARDPLFVMNYMVDLEMLAEDVLADKQQVVDLDKKRNSNREALTALRKKQVAPPYCMDKAWLNFGGMFIKVKKDDAITMLTKDQEELDKEIKTVQRGLHEKVNKLRDAQGQKDLSSFDLNPLTPKELSRVRH
ncbi:p53 and DNA damage-regulated protein 1-like isoform X1 [Clavelina lepadiformis]|uniref:p53 and DNA damage-regulated protein 1 n=1 Tax=Clavelina lepadiformis TaxID=159417 RepID=A0ABP0F1X7_CLALP